MFTCTLAQMLATATDDGIKQALCTINDEKYEWTVQYSFDQISQAMAESGYKVTKFDLFRNSHFFSEERDETLNLYREEDNLKDCINSVNSYKNQIIESIAIDRSCGMLTAKESMQIKVSVIKECVAEIDKLEKLNGYVKYW